LVATVINTGEMPYEETLSIVLFDPAFDQADIPSDGVLGGAVTTDTATTVAEVVPGTIYGLEMPGMAPGEQVNIVARIGPQTPYIARIGPQSPYIAEGGPFFAPSVGVAGTSLDVAVGDDIGLRSGDKSSPYIWETNRDDFISGNKSSPWIMRAGLGDFDAADPFAIGTALLDGGIVTGLDWLNDDEIALVGEAVRMNLNLAEDENVVPWTVVAPAEVPGFVVGITYRFPPAGTTALQDGTWTIQIDGASLAYNASCNAQVSMMAGFLTRPRSTSVTWSQPVASTDFLQFAFDQSAPTAQIDPVTFTVNDSDPEGMTVDPLYVIDSPTLITGDVAYGPPAMFGAGCEVTAD
ncbi:MAG: hypothetical protein AAF125_27615, partial [Chloroflexota bacterium]